MAPITSSDFLPILTCAVFPTLVPSGIVADVEILIEADMELILVTHPRHSCRARVRNTTTSARSSDRNSLARRSQISSDFAFP
jgi:hypothetical protein